MISFKIDTITTSSAIFLFLWKWSKEHVHDARIASIDRQMKRGKTKFWNCIMVDDNSFSSHFLSNFNLMSSISQRKLLHYTTIKRYLHEMRIMEKKNSWTHSILLIFQTIPWNLEQNNEIIKYYVHLTQKFSTNYSHWFVFGYIAAKNWTRLWCRALMRAYTWWLLWRTYIP